MLVLLRNAGCHGSWLKIVMAEGYPSKYGWLPRSESQVRWDIRNSCKAAGVLSTTCFVPVIFYRDKVQPNIPGEGRKAGGVPA